MKMKLEKLLKTGLVLLIITFFIIPVNAASIPNTNTDKLENDEVKQGIPPDWVDIGSGKITGEVTARDDTYGTWVDYTLIGLVWAYGIPMIGLTVYRKTHILSRGEIEWKQNIGEDVGGNILVNGKAYKEFYLTGFRGTFLKMGGGVPDADIFVNSLKVNGYANNVYVPPSILS